MLRIAEPYFMGREVEYVNDALQRKSLSMGEYVRRFEKLIAGSMNATHAVATTSGTTALHLALLALGTRPGDRVIVPACSYIAVANAVRYCGARPVFVDVRSDTWTLDCEVVERVMEEHNAVGVIAVDLYGVPCKVHRPSNRIKWVLQDACEAHGLPLDSNADAAVLSFYGNKIVTCGEGGAVVTNNMLLADRVALLRGQGTTGTRRYWHEELGFNYRMTDLQAALGCGQIEQLEEMLRRRRLIRYSYDSSLRGVVRQLRPQSSVDWVYPIRVADAAKAALKLEELGIETRPVFPPLYKQPPHAGGQESAPVAEMLAEQGLLLPLHVGMSHGDVFRVCDAVKAVL